MSCLFCKMAAGEIPVEFVFESSDVFAINDISPQAPTHVLVIPKAHHENAAELSANAPEDIDYQSYGINDALVIDNTGAFRDDVALARHLVPNGASKVLLTAPGKNVPNIVHGVNRANYDPKNVDIFSAASCTTNAIVPVLKVIEDNFSNSPPHLIKRLNRYEISFETITNLKEMGRPLICTEYMAREFGTTFQFSLPLFKDFKVGCYNWGLVAGKSQTHFGWATILDLHKKKENGEFIEKGDSIPEPEIWFHDILREDGSPYDEEEVAFIKKITGSKP